MRFRIGAYLRYLLKARGLQGLHSPFVFEFAGKVLKHKSSRDGTRIEAFRLFLCEFDREITREDFGAGAVAGQKKKVKIGDLALVASKRQKEGELLFRIAAHFQPKTILELGTHLGISGLYLQSGNPKAEFITLEGDPSLASLAQKHFKAFGFNPEILIGEFTPGLRMLLIDPTFSPDLVFIDGNHRKAATVAYFQMLLPRMKPGSILIFDDIHWSAEMESAWSEIKQHPEVTVSVDIFQFGICFFRSGQAKEDFVLKF